jgi:biotin synthase
VPSVTEIIMPSAGPTPDLLALSRRVIGGGDISREEARDLFTLEGEEVYDLLYAAHKVRRHFHGNRVTFCSILPTKFGNCSEDCGFCAQSAHFDTGITPHPMMDGDEVKQACADSKANGASAFGIVNSGRGPTQREWPAIMEAVSAMKEVDGICHCATLGRLTDQQARDLKAAGVRRINHNLETSQEYYPQVVTTHAWQERVDTVRLAQRVGLETCCGCIFGMGETIDDRVSVAFSLKELNPNVVPLNFLYPMPGTPLADQPRLRPLEILKIVATMRLILPHQDLKVAGGREKNLRDLQSWIFYAGATSALVGNYLASYGRPHEEDLQMIEDLELSWHDDRVGDADASVPAASGPAPGRTVWELPLVS